MGGWSEGPTVLESSLALYAWRFVTHFWWLSQAKTVPKERDSCSMVQLIELGSEDKQRLRLKTQVLVLSTDRDGAVDAASRSEGGGALTASHTCHTNTRDNDRLQTGTKPGTLLIITAGKELLEHSPFSRSLNSHVGCHVIV